MTEGNTFNVSRDIWGDEAFRDEPFTERQAWLWMVGEASWKARKKRVGDNIVSLERAQLAHSPRFMADTWDWSHGKVRRFLDRLVKLGKVELATGTGVTVVTICNYDKYQHGGTPTGTPADTQPAQDRHRTGTNEKTDERQREDRREEEPVGSSLPAPVPADDVSAAVSAYNEAAERQGWKRVAKLTTQRRAALKARMKDAGGLSGWEAAVERAEASDFLCGRRPGSNGNPFFASFDFLIRESSFTKLMEGNYDNRDRQPQQSSDRPSHGPDAALEQIFRLA